MTKYAKVGSADKKEKMEAIKLVCEAHPLKHPGIPYDFSNVPGSISFVMKLGGRLIINQAGGVLENAGLCIHRHFGYPYIPGSALKGLARHAAWWEWSETEEDDAEKLALAAEIADIFGFPTGDKQLDAVLKQNGATESKGKVSFLNAIPVKNVSLTPDILTSHHGCDTKNPIPLPFPVVEKGAEFSFTVVSAEDQLREKAVFWLKKALMEDGAGAKTAAGYGWFKEV
jgi:CRISPR type III-B/RAMP module RAMP protein Cmr6